MGIREHFQEHPPGEDLNIHDVAIEKDEKREPLIFDPETEISDLSWQGMKDRLEMLRLREEWQNFLTFAGRMKIIFPDRFSELDLDSDEVQQIIEKELENMSKKWDKDYHELLYWIMEIKFLFPEKANGFYPGNEVWQKIEEDLEKHRQNNEVGAFINLVADIKISFPEKIKDFHLNDQLWEDSDILLEHHRKKGEWASFFRLAMSRKIIFPERSKNSYFNDSIWGEMKKSLDEERSQGTWMDFSWKAMCMKIIAAYKVEVTDEGLDIIMRKPETFRPEKKIPRPERRRF